jgi:predicted metalloprotease with PDZ domain
MKKSILSLAFLAGLLMSHAAGAQQREPIRYRLRFPAPQTHYLEVDASIPTDGESQVDLMMPVWTPGSYLVREFARNVESLAATDEAGMALHVEKTRKNRWRVSAEHARIIDLHYRVYGREMSVRTNWIDDRFAQLNGAATFITRLESRDRPYEVRLELPARWSMSLSGMLSSEPNVYRADDYDMLVDSPIVAGNPQVYEFSAGGKPHLLVDLGEDGMWDGARAVQDLARVVRKTIELWTVVPYDRFLFLNVIGGSRGGLEHRNSTVIHTSRMSTRTPAAYHDWLSLASHEFMHPWNVKRLRPAELGPFDYENEVYTRSLWFAEGVSDYYGDLQLGRAGLSSVPDYLQDLSSAIRSLQTNPGRLVMPVETASFDAWIKYYRPNENADNDSVSYYVKGALIGFLLDAKLRHLTAGAKTLDDFMRLMYQRYSGPRGFTPQDLRSTALDLVGQPAHYELQSWFEKVLETTDELDYTEALEWFGLEFGKRSESKVPYLGISTSSEGGRTIITRVTRDTAAFTAGLDVDDEILAINNARLSAGELANRLRQFRPGDKVTITISRRDDIQRLDVTLGTAPAESWTLEVKSNATSEQSRHLQAWLQ